MVRLATILIGLLLIVGAPPASGDTLLDLPRPPRKKVTSATAAQPDSNQEVAPGTIALNRYARARRGNFNTYGPSSNYGYYNNYNYGYGYGGYGGYGYGFGGFYWGHGVYFWGPHTSVTFHNHSSSSMTTTGGD